MDAWLKIRVYKADLERWEQVAGHRGMSRFVREACNLEMRRRKAENQRHRPPEPSEPVEHVQPPPRLMAEPPPMYHKAQPRASRKTPLPECRHGLVNCRVCGTGIYEREEA